MDCDLATDTVQLEIKTGSEMHDMKMQDMTMQDLKLTDNEHVKA